MGNGKKSGRNSESDSLAQNISSSDPSNFRWPIQCCLISKTIQRAKEATLENQNSLVQIRAYYFHIFLHLLLSSKANEQKARKILMCRLYCSLFGGVCTAFPHLHRYRGVRFGVLFKFSALLWNRMLPRKQSGKELGAGDKTSFLHVARWHCIAEAA